MNGISPHYFLFVISLHEFYKFFVRTVTKLIPKYITVKYFDVAVPHNSAKKHYIHSEIVHCTTSDLSQKAKKQF